MSKGIRIWLVALVVTVVSLTASMASAGQFGPHFPMRLGPQPGNSVSGLCAYHAPAFLSLGFTCERNSIAHWFR